ncbi:MAG: nicotinate phosphoribosyltransferase, partial [Coriobacteriia bacterium]|nr:nicotinate phosphoribosyltransferase [Coriobacteriia bacterium]
MASQEVPVGQLMHSALLTDLYQLTMAQAYFESGHLDTQACFHLYFRDNPFKGGYAIACGTSQIADIVSAMHFSDEDIAYLRGLQAPAGGSLFSEAFLGYLSSFSPSFTIDAVKEGRIVFPREPMVRVMGPLIECQLIETILLNHVNFQTLIATKAQRVVQAAQGGAVAEFGLRRAQGPDGGLSASRAAYIGGCASTSNVLAGKLYGIPVSGTHAHSWVMAFSSELEAFRAYVKAMPNNAILLVDTYEVEQGVKNAIIVAQEMKERGEKLLGIRIDSGDLAELSKMARKMFDEAGLPEVNITVSNDLDEYTIQSLLAQGAPIDSWGVGTKLATSYDQPTLGGVYKLSAVKNGVEEQWQPVIKMSEQQYKLTIPGVLEVRRYFDDEGKFAGDMICDESFIVDDEALIIDPLDGTLSLSLKKFSYKNILEPHIRNGKVVCEAPSLEDARARVQEDLGKLQDSVKRFLNPQVYPVGIERSLFDLRTQ